jgi:hypothetical protein
VTEFLARHQTLLRAVFGVHAGTLFVLTHWPNLKVEGPMPRPDLWAHFIFFGGWCAFATLAGLFGPALSPANIAQSSMLALTYAAFDEGLQAIPALGRTCALDDFGANTIGVLGSSLLLLGASWIIRHVQGRRS